MAFKRLTAWPKPPTDSLPHAFVTIHHGIGGWNSSVWAWTPDKPSATLEGAQSGFWEPCVTGFTNTSLGTGLRKDAVLEATSWAEGEGLPLYIPPDGGEE